VLALDLGHFLGLDGAEWYAFWSGAGADLGQLALIGGAITLYRKHNCHVHRCWRLGKFPIDGTPWVVCHRHHPDGRPTEAHIARLKERANDG
jgi:hypothetical protein